MELHFMKDRASFFAARLTIVTESLRKSIQDLPLGQSDTADWAKVERSVLIRLSKACVWVLVLLDRVKRWLCE